LRFGIDLGGTKISGIALDLDGKTLAHLRSQAPRDSYPATIEAIVGLVDRLSAEAGGEGSIGIGMPGSMSPVTGLVQGSNSVWINGRSFGTDLEARLGKPVRLANDANCFALSEAVDGAGAGAKSVFGVIIGTGCGGGLVYQGQLVDGPNAIGGEWGHNPLPWMRPEEYPGPMCWCGRPSCLETWVSGSGLAADYARATGDPVPGETVVARAAAGEAAAKASLARHADRLARGIAHVVNIFDPEVIVLGGGLSNLSHLYEVLPGLAAPYVFATAPILTIRKARWGDDSGVRGAAWLWR
jgi:fructokinase